MERGSIALPKYLSEVPDRATAICDWALRLPVWVLQALDSLVLILVAVLVQSSYQAAPSC